MSILLGFIGLDTGFVLIVCCAIICWRRPVRTSSAGYDTIDCNCDKRDSDDVTRTRSMQKQSTVVQLEAGRNTRN